MLPAANRGLGFNFCFPDVCLTPPGVPTPYPNFGLHAMAFPFAFNVFLMGVNALNVASLIPLTSGDEPGIMGPIKGPCAFMVGNPVVMINFLPGINLLCPALGNFFKAPGLVVLVGALNVLFTYAQRRPEQRDPRGRALEQAEIDALLRELASVGREEGPPVTARMVSPGVGEVVIRVFSADVPARVLGAVRALEAEGMKELVVDLRDNPGGEMRAFLELAGDFLEPGSEVATVIDAEGDETTYRSWQERPYRFPVTLLVNRGTASAAELFAECLEAHGRARVEGGEMYGKRVGQAVGMRSEGGPRMETRVRVMGYQGECAQRERGILDA